MTKRIKITILLRIPTEQHQHLDQIVKSGMLGSTMDEVVTHMLRQFLWGSGDADTGGQEMTDKMTDEQRAAFDAAVKSPVWLFLAGIAQGRKEQRKEDARRCRELMDQEVGKKLRGRPDRIGGSMTSKHWRK